MGKLLLIVDMQEGFRNKYSEAIVPKILSLSKKFNGGKVFMKFVNQKGSPFDKLLGWKQFCKKHEQDLFIEFNAHNTIQLEHNTYTILNRKLKNLIKKLNISCIYLCGIYSDVCIMKAAMDIFDYRIKTYVIRDACTSLHGKQFHITAMRSLSHILGKHQIISTLDLLKS